MANDMTQADYEKLDREYMEGPGKSLDQCGSVIMTSSKFLNSARFRDVYAQEGLRRQGRDVPTTILIHKTLEALGEVQDGAEIEGLFAKDREKNPELAAWLEARKLAELSIGELSRYAPDSFGGMIHAYVAARPGFELNFTRRGLVPTSDWTYFQKEATLSHDLEHMITGFGTNPVGEQALIACNVKSFCRYFSPELAGELTRLISFQMSTNVMKTNLHYPQVLGTTLEAWHTGIEMGDALKRPLVMTDWLGYLDWPVEEMRRDLNIANAPPPGTWDWTSESRRG
jgi:ubiquinone biosynthesis protein Coq4